MPPDPADRKAFVLANVEGIAKLATVALGLLYVFGFLVSNIQLMALGIADFSALQARNIMIGFLFVGYFAICAATLYPIAAIPQSYLRALAAQPDRNKIGLFAETVLRQAFVFLVMLWAVALAIGQFLPWGIPYWNLWRIWLSIGSNFDTTVSHVVTGHMNQLADAFLHTAILFSAVGIVLYEILLIFSIKERFEWRNEQPATWLMLGVLLIVVFAFFLYGYANDVYPNLKYNLGGGQPQIANLTLAGKKSDFAGLENSGLIVNKTWRTEQVPAAADADQAIFVRDIAIWYQSDKFLYIAGATHQTKSRVVAIDLKLVRSIHYLPKYVRVHAGARIVRANGLD